MGQSVPQKVNVFLLEKRVALIDHPSFRSGKDLSVHTKKLDDNRESGEKSSNSPRFLKRPTQSKSTPDFHAVSRTKDVPPPMPPLPVSTLFPSAASYDDVEPGPCPGSLFFIIDPEWSVEQGDPRLCFIPRPAYHPKTRHGNYI